MEFLNNAVLFWSCEHILKLKSLVDRKCKVKRAKLENKSVTSRLGPGRARMTRQE